MGRMNPGSRHLQRALDAVAAMGIPGAVVVPELPSPYMIDDDGGADHPV